jgi:hypothetical protein
MASPFKGISDPKVGNGTPKYAPFLKPGSYQLAVKSAVIKQSQKNKKDEFFIVTFSVLNADKEAVDNGWKLDSDEAAWMVNTDWQGWLSDVKGFLAAVLGVDEIDEDLCDKVISEEQPAAGLPVNCHVWHKQTNSGGDFSVHSFKAAA